MSLQTLRARLNSVSTLSPKYGSVVKISSEIVYAKGIDPSVGDIVRIIRHDGSDCLGMVIVSESDKFGFTPFSYVEGFKRGDKVILEKRGLTFPVGDAVLGRVLDPLGNPLDGGAALDDVPRVPVITPPIAAMKRGIIEEPFETGVKTLDALLTCGKGQKMGIFAGSGVGKSTLIGMIVKGSPAPVKVIALIGERGREVPEFIKKNLNGNLADVVLIVATSDDPALMRKYGAFCAMAVAERFKDAGRDVLFIMDSVTRFAMAQREIGLAAGEPPASKGYPPSVLSLLPRLMERAGKEEGKGSITAFFTVLVEGDDLSDPVADQARSILDGHVVLSRELTDYGIYPPIDVLRSSSRLANSLIAPKHAKAAAKFRRLLSSLKENEVLIRIGSYQKGFDADLDEAVEKKPLMEEFLTQDEAQNVPYSESVEKLTNIM